RILIENYEEFEDVKEKAILKFLAQQPIVVTVTPYSSFRTYIEVGDSVYMGCLASDVVDFLANHAILLVGYG
ncbi:hypothetical protein LINPERHAP1_LOCUS35506, partial [Linum perenne]